MTGPCFIAFQRLPARLPEACNRGLEYAPRAKRAVQAPAALNCYRSAGLVASECGLRDSCSRRQGAPRLLPTKLSKRDSHFSPVLWVSTVNHKQIVSKFLASPLGAATRPGDADM